jgi:small GTP-binding protein
LNIKGKICLLGDNAVGKTSLIRRYVLDAFEDKYISTIGTKITKKAMKLRHPKEKIKINMTLLIWDIMGDMNELPEIIHSYNKYSPQKKYFENAKGAIVVCDITRKNTFQNVEDWVKAFREIAGDAPIVFVGNKADLQAISSVEARELEEISSKYNSRSLFTSAKTGQNVEQAFSKLSKLMAFAHLKGDN